MHSENYIEEISRGVINGSAERKGLTGGEKHSIELKEVREDWERALRGIRKERIRHARKLAKIHEDSRVKERDAAESERKRCNILERKVAKVKEIVAARETTAWSFFGHYIVHFVTTTYWFLRIKAYNTASLCIVHFFVTT